MAFKNVLVISDNIYVFKRFFEIIRNKDLPNCHFSYSISPFSDKNQFNISGEIEILTIDLKNKKDIEFICKEFDLLLSVHCRQIFPPDLVNRVKCINIHPGYNPVNRGWYPQVFSIINKLPVGATIHEIDEKLDHGGIIVRELVEKETVDTSKSLYKKIVDKEMELVEAWIEKIIKNEYSVTVPEEEGKLYSKQDFYKLLKLDLNEMVSAGDFIDRLRALTFEGFDNAYFVDPETGKKIFVEIRLKMSTDI